MKKGRKSKFDREIYRGCFIQEPEGIAVMLNHRIEEARPMLYTYAAQVCVRFADRDEAWQTLLSNCFSKKNLRIH